jgi:hypothetical protein
VPDDLPLPTPPVVVDKMPKQRKRKTTRVELRQWLRKNPPTDPHLLLLAVESGLLSRDEAERRLKRTWGKGFSLSEFEAGG